VDDVSKFAETKGDTLIYSRGDRKSHERNKLRRLKWRAF